MVARHCYFFFVQSRWGVTSPQCWEVKQYLSSFYHRVGCLLRDVVHMLCVGLQGYPGEIPHVFDSLDIDSCCCASFIVHSKSAMGVGLQSIPGTRWTREGQLIAQK